MTSASFFIVAGLVSLLLAILAWLARAPRVELSLSEDPSRGLEPGGRGHATYCALIRQVLSPAELDFIAGRGTTKLARRTQRERQQIALHYLLELRADFQRLLRLARIIAVLSPELGAGHEFERVRLTLQFEWRFRILLLALRSRVVFERQLSSLSLLVSGLAARLDALVHELGEQAAAAAEIASALKRRGLDTA